MTKRTSAVLERPTLTQQERSEIVTQVAILDRTATQALATAFELEARARRLANALHEIAAREGIPSEVKYLAIKALEAAE